MCAQIRKLSILNSGIQIKFTFQYFHEYTHFNIVPVFRICMHDWHTLCLFILINSCKYSVYRYTKSHGKYQNAHLICRDTCIIEKLHICWRALIVVKHYIYFILNDAFKYDVNMK